MAEKEIKITFAGEKLEALSFFLAEQGGKTVEELLKSHLDKSYEKNVPAQVRKFVESRLPSSTTCAMVHRDLKVFCKRMRDAFLQNTFSIRSSEERKKNHEEICC